MPVPCGEDVTLTARAYWGHTLTGWAAGGACGSVKTATCTVTTSASTPRLAVEATFAAIDYPYDRYLTAGPPIEAGSYSFLTGGGEESGGSPTVVTTYDGLRRDARTLRINTTAVGATGASASAALAAVHVGTLIEWREAADCFVRYRVRKLVGTGVDTAPGGYREFRVRPETYAFEGCPLGALPTDTAPVAFNAAPSLPLKHLGGTRLSGFAIVHGPWQFAPRSRDVATKPMVDPAPTGQRLKDVERRRQPLETTNLSVAQGLPAWREPLRWIFVGVQAGTAHDDGFAGYDAWWLVPDRYGDLLTIRASYAHPDRREEAVEPHYLTTDGHLVVRELRTVAGRPAWVEYSPVGPQHTPAFQVSLQVFDAETETVYLMRGGGDHHQGGEDAAELLLVGACELFLSWGCHWLSPDGPPGDPPPFGEPPPGRYTAISVGRSHACALTEQGEPHCWGRKGTGHDYDGYPFGDGGPCVWNERGETVCSGGDRTRRTPPPGRYTAISAGDGHTCAVATGGELVCWGDRLLDGPPGRYRAVSTSGIHACALTEEGQAVCWGHWPDDGRTHAPPGRYVAISADYNPGYKGSPVAYSCALSEDGEAVCWWPPNWDNIHGSWSRGSAEDAEPRPGPHSSLGGVCRVTTTGEAYCRETPFADRLPPGISVPGGASARYTAIDASAGHACALTTEGRAVCGLAGGGWGEGWATVMHPPDPAPGRYVAIDVGGGYACALTDLGEVVCWTAVHNKVAPPDPAPGRYVAVSDGPYHTCALTAEGEAVCWGWNHLGQAQVPAGRYTAISAGALHTCALTAEGEPVCWGENFEGQADPPEGSYVAISAGTASTCALTEEGKGVCWGAINDRRNRVPEGRYAAVSVGTGRACAIAESGHAVCWSSYAGNSRPPRSASYAAISVNRHSYACAVTSEGEVTCWGNGEPAPSIDGAIAVAVGDWHACALTEEAEAVCWGEPPAGDDLERYISAVTYQYFSVREDGQADPPPGRYTAISAGAHRTCAVTVDGEVVCWGDTGYELLPPSAPY